VRVFSVGAIELRNKEELPSDKEPVGLVRLMACSENFFGTIG